MLNRAKQRRASRKAVQKDATGPSTGTAAASGIRGLGSGIIGTMLANQVRASAGKAGLAGVAAGLAFNLLLRRSPVGAVVFGGAILARQAFKSSKQAQAARDMKKALAKGALAAPPEASVESPSRKLRVTVA